MRLSVCVRARGYEFLRARVVAAGQWVRVFSCMCACNRHKAGSLCHEIEDGKHDLGVNDKDAEQERANESGGKAQPCAGKTSVVAQHLTKRHSPQLSWHT